MPPTPSTILSAMMHRPGAASRSEPKSQLDVVTDWRFVLALVVLIANDHFLKQHFGNWVTGKVSDVAGLVVLPVVVAGALGALRVARALPIACVAIGTWFAAIKTLAPIARATEQLAEAVTGSAATIVVDPTDLIGLLGIWLAVAIVQQPRPLLSSRLASRLLFAVAILACTATSNDTQVTIDLGVDDNGEVIAIQSSSDDVFVEEDVSIETKDGLGVLETQACLAAGTKDAGACFRLVDGRVERQSGDENWQLEWALLDLPSVFEHVGGGLNHNPTMKATDVVTTPTGEVHVAFSGIKPVVRSANGEWHPAASTYRPIRVPLVLLFGMAGAAFAAATRTTTRQIVVFVLAAAAPFLAQAGWGDTANLFSGLYTVGAVLAAVIAGALGLVFVRLKLRPDGVGRGRMALACAGIFLAAVALYFGGIFRTFPWAGFVVYVLAAAAISSATRSRTMQVLVTLVAAAAAVAWIGLDTPAVASVQAARWLSIAVIVGGFVVVFAGLTSRSDGADYRRLAIGSAGLGAAILIQLAWKYVVAAPGWLLYAAPAVAAAAVIVELFVPMRAMSMPETAGPAPPISSQKNRGPDAPPRPRPL